RAEAALYDSFLDLTAGLTTIVVSHRFSTVRRADKIVVLEGGRIVEAGSHDELMALKGRYARMFDLQARYYSEAPPSPLPAPNKPSRPALPRASRAAPKAPAAPKTAAANGDKLAAAAKSVKATAKSAKTAA